MGMRRSSGQVFVIGAVLFASFIVILFLTADSFQGQQDSNAVKRWFENVLDNAPVELNQALEDEYSVDHARNRLYSYSRFVERSSVVRGIDFQANYLLVFPGKGKAVFINYRDSSQQLNLEIDSGWTNTTVGSDQYREESFSPGKTDFRVDLPEQDVNRSFTASNPRIFSWVKMAGQDQVWINSELD